MTKKNMKLPGIMVSVFLLTGLVFLTNCSKDCDECIKTNELINAAYGSIDVKIEGISQNRISINESFTAPYCLTGYTDASAMYRVASNRYGIVVSRVQGINSGNNIELQLITEQGNWMLYSGFVSLRKDLGNNKILNIAEINDNEDYGIFENMVFDPTSGSLKGKVRFGINEGDIIVTATLNVKLQEVVSK